MASALKLRTIVVHGHRTSIRLEPAMWRALEDISGREGQSINEICSSIAASDDGSSLTAAVRVFIMTYFQDAARHYEAIISSGAVLDDRRRLFDFEERFRDDILQRSFVEIEDDCEEKLRWKLEALGKLELHGLGAMLATWMRFYHAHGRIPSLADIQPEINGNATVLSSTNVIDVGSENPQNFMLLKSSSRSDRFWASNMSNMLISRYPSAAHALGMQVDFNDVKTAGFPACHTIRHLNGKAQWHYARILLPLSDDGKTTARLLSITRPIEAPVIHR